MGLLGCDAGQDGSSAGASGAGEDVFSASVTGFSTMTITPQG
ncbi:hypothetical protein [Caulobacter sp. 602-1]|nr:hypothetical protein [Caulobacter sp. 602-1]